MAALLSVVQLALVKPDGFFFSLPFKGTCTFHSPDWQLRPKPKPITQTRQLLVCEVVEGGVGLVDGGALPITQCP